MSATLITAHNGADGTPENSMEFVRHALASGADALEIDIRRLPDGELVFTHDLPAALTGIPSAIPPKTLQAKDPVSVQTVFDALRESHTGQAINCDLKEAGLESAVYELAVRSGIGGQVQFSGTVSARDCLEKGLNARVKILLNIEEYVPGLYRQCMERPGEIDRIALDAARRISEVCLRYGISCINANYRLATDGFMDILAEQGLELSVWTVNDPRLAARFVRRGIYNVTTRNLREILCPGDRT